MAGTPRRLLRRLAPWLLAGVVLAVLLLRHSPDEIAREMARGEALAILPWAALVAILALGSMALADHLLFAAALGAPRRVLEVARGRAATAILMTFGNGATVGGYGLWLARVTGAGARATLAAVLFQVLCDLAALCWFALGAAALGAGVVLEPARQATLVVAALGAVALPALLLWGAPLLPRRLGGAGLARVWTRVGAGRLAGSLLLRVVTVAINIGGTFAAARAFGLDIPPAVMAVGLPVVYLVGALPINVLGLGAASAVWVTLFAAHAPGAELLAFQFLYQLAAIAMLVVRGLPFLPGVLRDLGRGRAAGPAVEQQAGPAD